MSEVKSSDPGEQGKEGRIVLTKEDYPKISIPPPPEDARGPKAGALGRALQPEIEEIIIETLKENPKVVVNIVGPLLGKAIRRSIATSLQALVTSIQRQTSNLFGLRKLAWRWEAWRKKRPYAEIALAHSLIYKVEQVFLIHRETGILALHASATDEDDRDIVSSMLKAMESFVRDSFDLDEDDSLHSIHFGEWELLIKSSPDALLAAAVRGTATPDFHDKLEETLETLSARYGSLIREYEGDPSTLKATFPLLVDCLETETA